MWCAFARNFHLEWIDFVFVFWWLLETFFFFSSVFRVICLFVFLTEHKNNDNDKHIFNHHPGIETELTEVTHSVVLTLFEGSRLLWLQLIVQRESQCLSGGGYLSYCCLRDILKPSASSSLTPGINKASWPGELLLAGYFLNFGPFSRSVCLCVCENPSGSAVWKTLKRATCHPQPCDHVQSHWKHHSLPFSVFFVNWILLFKLGKSINLSRMLTMPWRSHLSMSI